MLIMKSTQNERILERANKYLEALEKFSSSMVTKFYKLPVEVINNNQSVHISRCLCNHLLILNSTGVARVMNITYGIGCIPSVQIVIRVDGLTRSVP